MQTEYVGMVFTVFSINSLLKKYVIVFLRVNDAEIMIRTSYILSAGTTLLQIIISSGGGPICFLENMSTKGD